MNASPTQPFLDGAAAWIVDGGSLAIRFLASVRDGAATIIDSSLEFGPRKISDKSDFLVRTSTLAAGQRTFPSVTRAKALEFIQLAIAGNIKFRDVALTLRNPESHAHYSESLQRDRWQGDLHLQIPGEAWPHALAGSELANEDNELRACEPPFDGMNELARWLSLTDTRTSLQRPAIAIRILMPVDVIFSTKVSQNHLHLLLIAHKKTDPKKIKVAVRAFPGDGLNTRRQVSSLVKWQAGSDGFKNGSATIKLDKAESVLVMLTYAGQLARRQWFIDPEKATNTRLLVLQTFDRELKQLRQVLLEATDAARFERAVCTLLFLLGFAPAPVLETQAPDLVIATPGGAIAIVECTTRIADFAAKVGKLVDRRQALVTQLEANGHAMRVIAFLVSSQPRAQVAVESDRLKALGVALLTREDIVEGLTRTRLPRDPDAVLANAAKQLAVELPN